MQLVPVGDVALEGLLRRDRDPLDLGLEPARVDPARAVAEYRPDLAGKEPAELRIVQRRQCADRGDAGGAQPFLGARADAGEEADVERREERGLPARPHDGEAARLPAVGRHLRDDLGGGHAERAGQSGGASDGRLHRFGDAPGGEEVRCHFAEVEVALVEAGALDGRDDLADRGPHRARVVAVERVPGPEEDRLRTAAQRLGAAHRRVDPVPPGDVVRGRDHAPPVRIAADDERLPPQRRVLEHLDRSEEGVEIEMRDDHPARIGTGTEATRTRDGHVNGSPVSSPPWVAGGSPPRVGAARRAGLHCARCGRARLRAAVPSRRGGGRRSGCAARVRDGRLRGRSASARAGGGHRAGDRAPAASRQGARPRSRARSRRRGGADDDRLRRDSRRPRGGRRRRGDGWARPGGRVRARAPAGGQARRDREQAAGRAPRGRAVRGGGGAEASSSASRPRSARRFR